MRYVLFIIPVWLFSFGALWIGTHPHNDTSHLYTGFGALGIVVANALMAHNKCLRDLENRLKELERKLEAR